MCKWVCTYRTLTESDLTYAFVNKSQSFDIDTVDVDTLDVARKNKVTGNLVKMELDMDQASTKAFKQFHDKRS